MASAGAHRRVAARAGRLPCRAVFLDAGGVIVLPHRGLVAHVLAQRGVAIDPDRVPRAHFLAVRELDRSPETVTSSDAYLEAFCAGLGIDGERRGAAVAALAGASDRRATGEILWSEPAPGAKGTIAALARAGVVVVVVTNSDGHAQENLRDSGVCDVAIPPREDAVHVRAVIDSVLVASSKPDAGIFLAALAAADAAPGEVVHVGDTVAADVAGARAAGIAPIHLDPYRFCRDRAHRHIRTLPGLWRHIAPTRPGVRGAARGSRAARRRAPRAAS